MRILDLYCGAGGASAGYAREGHTIIGVDNNPKLAKNYPYEFVCADVLSIELSDFDVDFIHASPPCQAHSTAGATARKSGKVHIDLIPETREMLNNSGLPWVIENVPGAPLIDPVKICGSAFGLDIRRHRLFEANWDIKGIDCDHGWQTRRFRSLDSRQVKAGILAKVVGVHGKLQYAGEGPIRQAAMDIDWMTTLELSQAIPPAYTQYIAQQF